MEKRLKLGLLGLMMFAPLAGQLLAAAFQNYGLGLILRVATHIALPIGAVMLLRQLSLRQAALLPLLPPNRTAWRETLLFGALGGLIAVFTIVAAYLMLGQFVDWAEVIASLSATFKISPAVYPWVALAIVAVNPLLEEYFWRGFIFRAFHQHAASLSWQRAWLYLTGIFFSLHHVIIINDWFIWWQWLIVVGFLAGVGVLFNWLYLRTGSILASWFIHLAGDATIVTIGFILFGYT